MTDRLIDLETPIPTGNSMADEVNEGAFQSRVDARNKVQVPSLYEQSLQTPEVQADKPPESRDIKLTSDDDFLPYLHDVESNWDLREQAYRDHESGVTRNTGDVSNRYLKPNTKTVHGIDVATGQRILDRDSGNPAAESKYERGAELLRGSDFNVTNGYTTPEGVDALSTIAEGVVLEDKGITEFERKLDLMGVPPEQARLAWDEANRRQGQQVMADIYADVADNAVEDNEPVDLPDIDAVQLPEVEGWRDATSLVYEAEEGRPFEGDDEELVDWYVEQMSSFNWKIGVPGINDQGMAYYTARAFQEDDQYAKALLHMIGTYDRVNTSMSIIGENVKQLLTDPVNLVGVPGAGAVGFKVAGKAAQKAMVKALSARVGKETSEKVGSAMAVGAGAGGINTGLVAGGGEAAVQQIEQEAGYRENIDPAAIATTAAVGAVVGTGVGTVLGPAALAAAPAFRAMRNNARKQAQQGPLRRQVGAINPRAVKPFQDIPEPLQNATDLESSFKLADENHFPNMRMLKDTLQQRSLEAQKASGVDLTTPSAEADKILTSMVVADAATALRANSNAIGWYGRTVSQAKETLAAIHPEIQTDPNAEFAFMYALANTSNGLKVDKNFQLAEQAYQYYKANGKMPEDLGIGNAGGAMKATFKLYNQMVDEMGVDGLRELFNTRTTVGDLKKRGFNISGERVGTEVYGSAIIGPKIGNGFFSNLMGNFDQLTMDRWLRRTWGRLNGTLIAERPDLVAQKHGMLRDTIKLLRADKEALKSFEELVGKVKMRSADDLNSLSVAIQKASMSPENRVVMNQSEAGSLLRRLGNGLAKDLDGQLEAPTAAERTWIRRVFQGALEQLQEENPDLTMADLQALLWYPEKRLYDKSKSTGDDVAEGYADDEAPDYANAARDLARKLGVEIDVNSGAGGAPDGRSGTTRRGAGTGGAEEAPQTGGSE